MEITEVRITLVNRPDDRLRAFCSINIDNEFVVRDIKVVMGSRGLVMSMPSQKITDHCPQCNGKNAISSKFCVECGCKLLQRQGPIDKFGRVQLFIDIVHPLNNRCRDMIRQKVLEAYEAELKKSGRTEPELTVAHGRPSQYSGWTERT